MEELKACPRCCSRQMTDKESGETVPYVEQGRSCDVCGFVMSKWNYRPLETSAYIRGLRRAVEIANNANFEHLSPTAAIMHILKDIESEIAKEVK